MSRRLPPARRRRVREVLRREASAPRAARHVRLRPARAQPRGDQGRRSTSRRPAASRRRSSSRCCRSRARACSTAPSCTSWASPARRARASRRRPARTTRARAGNLKTYKPLEHQHVPEIVADARATPARKNVELRFVPVSAPLTRGIFATCFVELDADVDKTQARGAVRRVLRARAVRARARRRACPRSSRSPAPTTSRSASRSARSRTASAPSRCFSAIDNLIKGGAGQAIQNMNLVLGCDEKAEPRGRRELAVTPIVVKIGGEVIGSGEAAAPRRGPAHPRRRGRARRDRPRRRPAGHRAAEAARHRDQAGRRPPRHRRRHARRHEDGRSRASSTSTCAPRSTPRASPPSACTARPAWSCARRAARRRSTPARGPDPVDMGFVGDVVGFNLELLETLWAAKLRPGHRVPRRRCRRRRLQHQRRHGRQPARRRAQGRPPVPRHVGARRPEGHQRSVVAPRRSSRAPRPSAAIADGTVQGGMIPKLEEAMAVVDQGVGAIHILGKLAPATSCARCASPAPSARRSAPELGTVLSCLSYD